MFLRNFVKNLLILMPFFLVISLRASESEIQKNRILFGNQLKKAEQDGQELVTLIHASTQEAVTQEISKIFRRSTIYLGIASIVFGCFLLSADFIAHKTFNGIIKVLTTLDNMNACS